ncbi:Hypothetical predicted protein [Pelobates cultripes]|uniref:FAM193 C-terminal domain-containing protein n=2 Tax=Pelobates cultripes TaxID=61616 RepID=A0AAD1RRR6_PELCU|nr:Hypothetical predicted protein [Pelobates cultripes]
MTRRRNKQAPSRKERAAVQQRPCQGSLAPDGGEMGTAGQVLPPTNQFVQTCCLLCHRERKDWVGSLPQNGLVSQMAEMPASFMPSLAQNLLGEMPLWICQSCRKSVEEEERRIIPEQPLAVSLSHTSCKSQSCGGGSHSSSSSSSSTSCSSSSSSCHVNSADWDPSSFLSAHKLSELWNSTNSNDGTGVSLGDKSAGIPLSSEFGGKTPQLSGLKVCPCGSSTDSTGKHPTSHNVCKSPKQIKVETCHSSEHHQHSNPSAPPNSPTGISLRPQNLPLSSHLSTAISATSLCTLDATNTSSNTVVSNAATISPSKPHRGPHFLPSSPSLLNINTPPPLSSCSHPCNGNCSGGNVLPAGCTTGTTANRDAACKGHKPTNISCEDEDEDDSSERSSCTSSTNQKEGKFCDCCYCEFFGQNTPPPAPTSRNYPEMREKLRFRLTKRKEEISPKLPSQDEQTVDNRDVNELLNFINSNDHKSTTAATTTISSSKAAKRARYKLKKKEKVLQEASAQKVEDDYASIEDLCAPASEETLLQWPPLELEQVNSFLTSRLEEIKNTIKDSIRASFSVYDLNLDVNDFPKKAAMLEQKNLLSHLNGSSDLPEIDLDLSPLNLGCSKSQSAKSSEESEHTSTQSSGNGVVKRLSAVPNLSRMIWVQSSKGSGQSAGLKKSGGLPDTKALNLTELQDVHMPTAPPPATVGRHKKPKRPSLHVGKGESTSGKAVVAKTSTAGSKTPLGHASEKKETTQQGQSTISASIHSEERKDDFKRTGGDVVAPTGEVLCESPQPRKKGKKNQDKENEAYLSIDFLDDIFLPKDIDNLEMDETDREVEYFKRFCLDSAKQTRQKVVVNWTNFSLKKLTSSVAQ